MTITSVRSRLTLWNIGIFALVLSGFLVITDVTVHNVLLADLDHQLDAMVNRQERMIARPMDTHRPPPPPADSRRRRMARLVRLFDLTGHPLALPGPSDTPMDPPWDLHGYRLAVAGKASFASLRVSGTPLRVLSSPLLLHQQQIGVIQVAISYAEAQALLNSFTGLLVLLFPCALALAGMAGLILTNRVLLPVRQIIHSADSVHHEDLSQRLPVVGGDEFALLSTTINSMLARLEVAYTLLQQSVEKERRFTADASHELRTPLTAIKANTSLALRGERTPAQYREALLAIDQAGGVMQRLVQDLLILARADSGQLTLHCQPVDTHTLFATAITLTTHHAPHATIRVEEDPTQAQILADPHHLQQVLINLLENALRYTPADGVITLSAAAVDDRVLFTVADTGEGIAPEHLPHLGERFFRIDAARSREHGGTGLGLSICKSIIDAHGGTMTIESTVGQGTRVTVALPRANG